MTAGMIIGLILLPFVWALMAAVNKQHREETGVNSPTRDGWRRIRHNARKKGISEEQAYNQWLNRKTRKTSAAARSIEPYHVHRPPITKPASTAEELAQEAADEPLRTLASSRQLSLHRQTNGLYYFLNRGSGSAVLVKNPVNAATLDFTREQAIRFLSGALKPTPDSDEQLQAIVTARNWNLHRQANGLYYILNLQRSPSAFVRNPVKANSHEFTRAELEQFLSRTSAEPLT
jgi:hypothetical protein